MGKIYKAICDCGFTKEVTEGRGKFSAKTYIPIYCPICKDIQSIMGTETNCQKCGHHEIFRYFENPIYTSEVKSFTWRLNTITKLFGVNKDLFETIEKSNGKHLCPKCQNYSMRFELDRLWD